MDNAILEWRSLPRNPLYEISNYGEVRLSATKQLLKQYAWRGYRHVSIKESLGVFKTHRIHRLVLRTFKGEPPSPKHEGAHNDGTRDNNCISNLRWATHKENMADKKIHGTDHGGITKKLTPKEAFEIKRSWDTAKNLSKQYGVCVASIGKIRKGKIYKDAYPFKFWMAPTPKNLAEIHD